MRAVPHGAEARLDRRGRLKRAAKDKISSGRHQPEDRGVSPGHRLLEVRDREAGEDQERDDLLNGLELGRRIDRAAPPIGRHRHAIFDEGDPPARKDDTKERHFLEAQMAIPGERHEDIGADQKQYRQQVGWGWYGGHERADGLERRTLSPTSVGPSAQTLPPQFTGSSIGIAGARRASLPCNTWRLGMILLVLCKRSVCVTTTCRFQPLICPKGWNFFLARITPMTGKPDSTLRRD